MYACIFSNALAGYDPGQVRFFFLADGKYVSVHNPDVFSWGKVSVKPLTVAGYPWIQGFVWILISAATDQ